MTFTTSTSPSWTPRTSESWSRGRCPRTRPASSCSTARLRERSYSRFLTLEAERLLRHFGAETRVFDPHGLPLPDAAASDHPKVQELRELSLWSEGQVWCSPERHGAMSVNRHGSFDPSQGKRNALVPRHKTEILWGHDRRRK